MNRLKNGIALICLLSMGMMAAAGGQTPARTQLAGFLAAFNSGDRATITAFGRDHAPPDFVRAQIVDETLEMSHVSGGYHVLEINDTSPLALKSWVRARATSEVVLLTIAVSAESPERITDVYFISEEPPERLRSRE